MNPLVFRTTLCACLGLLIASVPAAGKEPGWYVGGAVGMGRSKISGVDEITNAVLQSGFTTAVGSTDEESIPFKLFLGYDFSRFFAVEGGAFYLAGTGFNIDATSQFGGAKLSGRTDVLGVNLDVLFKLPLGDKWRLFARGGGTFADSTFKLSADGAAIVVGQSKYEAREVGWKAGAGVQYFATPDVAFRAEWEHYRLDDGTGDLFNVDAYSISVLYFF
jgi:OOP family OmpA-OmpF porin